MKVPVLTQPVAWVLGVAVLAMGVAGGWWWGTQRAMPVPSARPEQPKAVLYWYDPMNPQQHFDKPGQSPFMDMPLQPRYAEPAAAAAVVMVPAGMQQALGIRLASVERRTLDARIEASGVLGFDERDVAIVQARAAGIVERAWPLAPGDSVAEGAPLVEVLVPEWSAAEQEFLAIRAAGDAPLLEAARARLRLLGLSPQQIQTLEHEGVAQERFVLRAPRAGYLESLEVRAGMSVTGGQTLARIRGLSAVWLEVAVPERQAGAVRVNARAEVRLASNPAEALEGQVSAILPALSEATRSARVRVVLPNPRRKLRAGESAQVVLAGAPQTAVLVVPTEAVIRTGKRSLVMRVQEGGYRPVEVTVGPEVGDRTVIQAGLRVHDQVVASGQFLLDSEASLQGLAPLSPEPRP